jgi:hypothetical protein
VNSFQIRKGFEIGSARQTQGLPKTGGRKKGSVDKLKREAEIAASVLATSADRVIVGTEFEQRLVRQCCDLGTLIKSVFSSDIFKIPEVEASSAKAAFPDLQQPGVPMSKAVESLPGTLKLLDDLSQLKAAMARDPALSRNCC